MGPTTATTEVEETSMVGPLGGDAGAQKCPPPYVVDVDGGPLGGDAGVRERPPPYVVDIDGAPLGGDA
jgi:hypothetical protein